jgi:hypothetical protein
MRLDERSARKTAPKRAPLDRRIGLAIDGILTAANDVFEERVANY